MDIHLLHWVDMSKMLDTLADNPEDGADNPEEVIVVGRLSTRTSKDF